MPCFRDQIAVRLQRSSGILLHLTSLPSRFGIGDLGAESRHVADALADAKQRVWCVLPFGPPGPFNSPYQSCSAFAGSPLLISPDELVAHGYLTNKDLRDAPRFPANRVDYAEVARYKNKLLHRAFLAFRHARRREIDSVMESELAESAEFAKTLQVFNRCRRMTSSRLSSLFSESRSIICPPTMPQ
jgi:4-alpha-glucanotransferase